jgi:RNA polymerase sigma-70 factor, ECF subfamily
MNGYNLFSTAESCGNKFVVGVRSYRGTGAHRGESPVLPPVFRKDASVEEEVTRLVERWRAGDEEAAAELFHRYARRLTALASSRLGGQVGQRVDAEDVVQSAYRSFFVGLRAGEYDLAGAGVWRLLVRITLNKLYKQVARHRTKKRDVRADHGFGSEDSLLGLQPEVLARDPSPLEAVALIDQVELLLRDLDPFCRKVLELLLRGCSQKEIVVETRRGIRSVERAIGKIKERLREGGGEAED